MSHMHEPGETGFFYCMESDTVTLLSRGYSF
jgi:hypothetical protein